MHSFVPITETKIQIFDPTQQRTAHIRAQLAAYKARWNNSLASNLEIIHHPSEHTLGIPLILPAHTANQFTIVGKSIQLSAISELTHHHLRGLTIEPVVHSISSTSEVVLFLESITTEAAYDFETASRFTDEQKAEFTTELETADIQRAKLLRQYITSDGLSHPSLTAVTHLSVATEEDESTVITISEETLPLVMDYLVTTTNNQIWHNLSFDGKHILHHTGKFPINYDDSQLMWATLKNCVDTFNAKSGLKGLAKDIYGDWAVNSTEFNLSNVNDPQLIHYAGIDSQATLYVAREARLLLGETTKVPLENVLPVARPEIVEERQTRGFFYHNVINPMVKDMAFMTNKGITIDVGKVDKLAVVIDDILTKVVDELKINPIVVEFQKLQYTKAKSEFIKDREAKKRSLEYYTKPLDLTKVDHRSYVMNYIDIVEQLPWRPSGLLPDSSVKWAQKDVKHLLTLHKSDLVQLVLDKTLPTNHTVAVAGMRMLALTKTNLYNKKYQQQITDVDESILPPFNPGSSKQLMEIFDYLGIPSENYSKETNNPKWDRKEIQRVYEITNDVNIKSFTQSVIDYSYSSIIKTTFLTGFEKYTVNGSLHGSIKLLGAKSARPTCSRINLLQLPSTGSLYAKPVKECFIARPGFITASSDYSALQEVTAANVTLDHNKVKILNDGYDSHCFHATTYYKEVEEELGMVDDGSIEFNKAFKNGCKTNPRLKELRQLSKPVSFKLLFGGMPDSDRGGNITQDMYDNFHNVLYPGVTKYNNEVVLTQATKEKEVYLGLGFSIKTDNPSKDIRTLANATAQFWDLITLIAIPILNSRIAAANLTSDIYVTATIYDAIYFEVREDPTIIKWLNDNLIEIMVSPVFIEQKVPNLANLDIGYSWASQTELPNNASIEEIEATLVKLKE